MLPTLMEVTTGKKFTFCVDFILSHASIVMTYASIIPLQDTLLLPIADEGLQYNLKKDSNLKVRTIFENSLRVLEMRSVKIYV